MTKRLPQKGDTVKIAFEGKVVDVRHDNEIGQAMIVRSETSGFTHAVFLHASADMTVKVKPPSHWPPREADVWKTSGGKLYLARQDRASKSVSFYETRVSLGGLNVETILADNPEIELVYRSY